MARPLLVAGRDPPPLLQAVDTPLHQIAPLVLRRVEVARPPAAPPFRRPSRLLVAPRGDQRRDAPAAQRRPTAGITVAFVGQQALDSFARPAPSPARYPHRVEGGFEVF